MLDRETMAKPNSHQLTAFTETARARSFSKAAAVLGVTQSSITQHVSNLEKLVGAPLFIRRRGGLEVTQAGKDLFEVTDQLRTLEQVVEEKIGDYGSLNAGTLRIVANAARPALPIIARYMTTYPGIEIDFTLVSWEVAMARLKERDVDLAFVVEPDHHEGLSISEIGLTTYRAFVHKQHPLGKRARIPLSALASETVILPEDGSLTQRVVREAAVNAGVRFQNILKIGTLAMVKEAVLHGVGVGFMLEDGQFATQNLRALEVLEMQRTFRHCLVTPSDKRNLQRISSFWDIAHDRLA